MRCSFSFSFDFFSFLLFDSFSFFSFLSPHQKKHQWKPQKLSDLCSGFASKEVGCQKKKVVASFQPGEVYNKADDRSVP